MIALLDTQGNSLRVIAKKLGCSFSTAALWKNRFRAGNGPKRLSGTGKSRKLSILERRDILLKVKRDPHITAHDIRQEIGRPDVCINTILRPIHEDRVLGSYWQTNKIMISLINQKKRVRWCRDHLHWTKADWNKVVFTDESPYVLRYNGRKRVWRRHNERYHVKALKGQFKNDIKINVWGCFCANGVGKFCLIEGIMDSKIYIKILDNELRPSVAALFKRKPYLFQQDNDSKHKSKATIDFIEDRELPYVPWPAQSPDLNPIENLWSILDQKCQSRKPKNAATLFDVLAEEWARLDVKILQNLVDSMPRRLEAVIAAKGLPTHY
jgi:hypothetical protein